jgi:hypothetical protein
MSMPVQTEIFLAPSPPSASICEQLKQPKQLRKIEHYGEEAEATRRGVLAQPRLAGVHVQLLQLAAKARITTVLVQI